MAGTVRLLTLAITVTVIGAIALSARSGIIVKDPAIFEQIDSCRTFIFDKTGTLTYGRPALTEIQCAPGFEEKYVLSAAASVERYSKHPLAQAISMPQNALNSNLMPRPKSTNLPARALAGQFREDLFCLPGAIGLGRRR
jgi:cation transport ATPase